MFGRRADSGWSPYLAGALVGVLVICSTYATTKTMGKPAHLDASETCVKAAGLMERQIWPGRVERSAYFQKQKNEADWQFMLVCGVFLGALVAALTGHAVESESVPPMWAKRYGPSPLRRGLCAVGGGVLALFGARLADGCPSSHGFSGLMQLSVGSFAAMGFFFVGGVFVARKMYRKGGRHE